MLNLIDLNKTIDQKQREHQVVLTKQFLAFRDQVEQGVTNIAEMGKRLGEITVVTEGQIKTHEIEELLRDHYYPISFVVTHNQTHDNPKEKKRSCFIAEVVIPNVEPNVTYGYDIIKGIE